jgi:hypothetical protein
MYDRAFSTIFATQWHVFVVLSALLLAASEAGFRVGLRHFRRPDMGYRSCLLEGKATFAESTFLIDGKR